MKGSIDFLILQSFFDLKIFLVSLSNHKPFVFANLSTETTALIKLLSLFRTFATIFFLKRNQHQVHLNILFKQQSHSIETMFSIK